MGSEVLISCNLNGISDVDESYFTQVEKELIENYQKLEKDYHLKNLNITF